MRKWSERRQRNDYNQSREKLRSVYYWQNWTERGLQYTEYSCWNSATWWHFNYIWSLKGITNNKNVKNFDSKQMWKATISSQIRITHPLQKQWALLQKKRLFTKTLLKTNFLVPSKKILESGQRKVNNFGGYASNAYSSKNSCNDPGYSSLFNAWGCCGYKVSDTWERLC